MQLRLRPGGRREFAQNYTADQQVMSRCRNQRDAGTRGGRPGTDVLGTVSFVTTGCGTMLLLAIPYSLPPDSGALGDCVPPAASGAVDSA